MKEIFAMVLTLAALTPAANAQSNSAPSQTVHVELLNDCNNIKARRDSHEPSVANQK